MAQGPASPPCRCEFEHLSKPSFTFTNNKTHSFDKTNMSFNFAVAPGSGRRLGGSMVALAGSSGSMVAPAAPSGSCWREETLLWARQQLQTSGFSFQEKDDLRADVKSKSFFGMRS